MGPTRRAAASPRDSAPRRSRGWGATRTRSTSSRRSWRSPTRRPTATSSTRPRPRGIRRPRAFASPGEGGSSRPSSGPPRRRYRKAQRLLKKASRPDLYKIVSPDLDESADEAALKKAYKKAALRWHPDRFAAKGEAEQTKAAEEFKRINDAYEFLTDPQRRRLWDDGYDREEVEQQLEMQKQRQQHGGGMGGFGGFPGGGFPGGFHRH